MYTVRWILVLILVFGVLVASTTQGREQAAKAWETVQPAVVSMAENLMAAIESFLASNTPKDRIHDTPGPIPSGNFQRIVTLSSSSVS